MALLPRAAVGARSVSEARTAPANAFVRSSSISAERSRPTAQSTAASRPDSGRRQYFDSRLNREATVIQHTLAFIDGAQGRLNVLKRAGSAVAATGQGGAGELEKPLQEFVEFWQTRVVATQGGLDQQLRVRGDSASRQTFSLRGLAAETLGNAAGETLQFMLAGQASASLVIEAGQPLSATLAGLDRVLAPLGVRVAVGDSQVVRFSAAETDWPGVRDELQVRGSGRLFPAGQFNRLRAETSAVEIQPESWRVDDQRALRDTLYQAMQLGAQLERAAGDAGQQLKALATPETSASVLQARALAANFASLAGQDDFQTLQAMLPAVTGLHRSRVHAVLDALV